MRLIFLALFINISLIACHPYADSSDKESIERDGDFTIEVIDSCQYVVYDHGIADQRVYAITHKGNCKYCQERKNR